MKKKILTTLFILSSVCILNANSNIKKDFFNCYDAADTAASAWGSSANMTYEDEYRLFSALYGLCMDGRPYEMTILSY
jgi:hypothetical protein